ncbi:MAG: chemotaxis response regulator protein-glutamate methylesterase [Gammaproteobacteria bacterium]
MAVRVLVVDDSGFFRRRVIEILEADPLIEVIGSAQNGEEAIEQAAKLKPDVITMDIEMPVLDGISATRKIMASNPTPIIMFSSLTTDGAKATLDALDAGALDFLPKRFEDIAKDKEEAKKLLCERVRSLARQPVRRTVARSTPSTTPPDKPARPSAAAATTAPRPAPGMTTAPAAAPRRGMAKGGIKLLAIGTSTGGPVALQKVLMALPANFPVPILMVQHMPGTFTPAFAQRLNQSCAIEVKQAEDGDLIKPGVAYLAPGGMQMLLDGRAGNAVLRVIESDPSLTYKPSVDITFRSITKVYPKETLAVVLTGMGADGREGARALKQAGSSIWAQDEASCVVYGMPAAIADAGLADEVISLDLMGSSIVQRV